jgi:hypothetical protein
MDNHQGKKYTDRRSNYITCHWLSYKLILNEHDHDLSPELILAKNRSFLIFNQYPRICDNTIDK